MHPHIAAATDRNHNNLMTLRCAHGNSPCKLILAKREADSAAVSPWSGIPRCRVPLSLISVFGPRLRRHCERGGPLWFDGAGSRKTSRSFSVDSVYGFISQASLAFHSPISIQELNPFLRAYRHGSEQSTNQSGDSLLPSPV
jgi:hypothetical protein